MGFQHEDLLRLFQLQLQDSYSFVSSNSSGLSLATQHPCTSMPVLTTNFPIPVVTTVTYPTASQLPHYTVTHPAVSQLPIAPVAYPTGSQLSIAADRGHQQPQLAISGNMHVQNPVQMHIPIQTLGAWLLMFHKTLRNKFKRANMLIFQYY